MSWRYIVHSCPSLTVGDDSGLVYSTVFHWGFRLPVTVCASAWLATEILGVLGSPLVMIQAFTIIRLSRGLSERHDASFVSTCGFWPAGGLHLALTNLPRRTETEDIAIPYSIKPGQRAHPERPKAFISFSSFSSRTLAYLTQVIQHGTSPRLHERWKGCIELH